MKFRNCIPITVMFALMGFWALGSLPVWEVSSAQAQEMQPLPTYDFFWNDEGNPIEFPNPSWVYDGSTFRTAQITITLYADRHDLNAILPNGWKVLFPEVYAIWIYKVLSQWPEEYAEDTQETAHIVVFAAIAKTKSFRRRLFLFSDIRSSGVDLNNDIMGAQVSREGNIKMEFMTTTDIGKQPQLTFNGVVQEPSSGLDLKVTAELPDIVTATRVGRGFSSYDYMMLELPATPSTSPIEGRPFEFTTEYDRYDYSEDMLGFDLDIDLPIEGGVKVLRLPGGRTVRITGFGKELDLRRNFEAYFYFP